MAWNLLRLIDARAYSVADEVISEVARRLRDHLLDDVSVSGRAEEVAATLVRIAHLGIGQVAVWLVPAEGRDWTALKLLAEEVASPVGVGVGPTVGGGR